MHKMKFILAPDLKKPVLDMERYKIMIACCIFEKRIQTAEDRDELCNLSFEIATGGKDQFKQLAKAPACALIKEKKIVFNLDYCAERHLTNDYPAILAHEIGRIFPQYSTKPKRFQSKLKDPLEKFSLFGIPTFDSAQNPYGSYVADWYALSWGFKDEINSYRFKILADHDYAEVLNKFPDEDAFRLFAYRFQKRIKLS